MCTQICCALFVPWNVPEIYGSTHWGRDKTVAIFQATSWIGFSGIKMLWISIKISLNFVSSGPFDNIPTIAQIMAWRWPGDNPLFEPMVVSILTHICFTRSQCVNCSIGVLVLISLLFGHIYIKPSRFLVIHVFILCHNEHIFRYLRRHVTAIRFVLQLICNKGKEASRIYLSIGTADEWILLKSREYVELRKLGITWVKVFITGCWIH